MNRFFVILHVGCLFLVGSSAKGAVIYQNDFDSSIGSEWSDASAAVTPLGGRRFLGIFRNETVTLSVANVPNSALVTVAFELFVINTWDGSQVVDPFATPVHTVGPDVWSLNVLGGPTLLNTTFSIFDGTTIHKHFPRCIRWDHSRLGPALLKTTLWDTRKGTLSTHWR